MVTPRAAESNPEMPPQLRLPFAIENAPDIVRQYGLREAHTYPLVAERNTGWHTTRRPTVTAWRDWPEIELRTPNSFPVLVLDCDTAPQDYWGVVKSGKVKPPNWIVSRGPNGHAHIVYCLARPVLRGTYVRLSPLRALGRIAEFYRWRYGADIGYVGVLTHNPTHPQYAPFTTWNRKRPYTLAELAEPIPYRWRIPPKPTTPEGRNVYLFRYGMRWCGLPQNWEHLDSVGAAIGQANQTLDYPLWESELRHIVKSVIRISRRNLEIGQTQRGFEAIQRSRGKRSGEVRRRRTAGRDTAIVQAVLRGQSLRAVARIYGLRLYAVQHIVHRYQGDQ